MLADAGNGGEGPDPGRPEARSLFLAELSHEIRTPLNAMLGLCHLAAHAPSPANQRDYLRQIQAAAHTLLRLVNDNLDLSRLEAGALTLAEAPVDLGALCQDLIQFLRPKADSKGLFFRIQWDPGTPRHFLGDADRLRQVLVNLLDNAVKYTPDGEVRLLVDAVEGGLRFDVQDTGPGLDAGQRAALFTPFVRPLAHRDGTGLGLALSRRLAQLMGGDVEVESQPGHGSSFRLTLPARTVDGPPAPHPGVLLVEGDPVLGPAFAAGLRPFVRGVTLLGSLAEAEAHLDALRAAGSPPPGLVILPYGAPRLQRRHGLPPSSLLYRVPARSARRAQKAMDLGWIHDFFLVPTDSARILDLLQEVSPPAAPGEPLPRFQGSPRILLVDDGAVNRMVTRELLERAGFEVTEAADGRSALRAALARPPACILMDLELPDMDGLEATRRIRALRGPHIPVVALTAHLLQDERRLCTLAGMDDFLAKPVEPDLLYRTLQRHLPSACRPRPAQPGRPSGLPHSIRWDYLRQRLQGNPDLLRRVLSQFRREAAFFRQSMREAMARGDMAALASLGHSLAGAAGNIGADAVALGARRLQGTPSSTNLAILEQALDRMEQDLAATDLLAPTAEPFSVRPDPGSLDHIRELLGRNSLDVLALLPQLRGEFRLRGQAGSLHQLEEALETLDFARALTLLDNLNPPPGGPHAPATHRPDRR